MPKGVFLKKTPFDYTEYIYYSFTCLRLRK